jgi:hypothetical protein
MDQKQLHVRKTYKTRKSANNWSSCFGKIVENIALSRVLLAVLLKYFNQLHDEVSELCCDCLRDVQKFRISVVQF